MWRELWALDWVRQAAGSVLVVGVVALLAWYCERIKQELDARDETATEGEL